MFFFLLKKILNDLEKILQYLTKKLLDVNYWFQYDFIFFGTKFKNFSKIKMKKINKMLYLIKILFFENLSSISDTTIDEIKIKTFKNKNCALGKFKN